VAGRAFQTKALHSQPAAYYRTWNLLSRSAPADGLHVVLPTTIRPRRFPFARQVTTESCCHCFAGCAAIEVLSAVGLSLADLFEKPVGHFLPKARVTFPALPILKALSLEATVVFICGAALLAGEPFDRDRLEVAIGRIDAGLRVAEGRS